ncbi:MAG TPA: nitroreductase [Lactobacillus sp.]|nr:nitroreductase [Lactobacillus sp.]
METELLSLMKQRRSIYDLGKNVDQSQADLTSLIQDVVKEAPSAFNSQTDRIVIAYGSAHDKVWDIVLDELKKVVPAEAFEGSKQKVEQQFKSGYGTILWFTDMSKVKELEDGFPLYADNFYDWSEQHIGNSQFAVWTALAENRLGASVQHYNPLIDAQIAETFEIPKDWRLRSEMPFGSIESTADDKDYMDDEDRFKVID